MIKFLIILLITIIALEMCSFLVDTFYFTYCRPISFSFNTFCVRLISSKSAYCTELNNLQFMLQRMTFNTIQNALCIF